MILYDGAFFYFKRFKKESFTLESYTLEIYNFNNVIISIFLAKHYP